LFVHPGPRQLPPKGRANRCRAWCRVTHVSAAISDRVRAYSATLGDCPSSAQRRDGSDFGHAANLVASPSVRFWRLRHNTGIPNANPRPQTFAARDMWVGRHPPRRDAAQDSLC
jgi:hypothetical protein